VVVVMMMMITLDIVFAGDQTAIARTEDDLWQVLQRSTITSKKETLGIFYCYNKSHGI
jgi:hypothetical protein